MNVQSSSWSVAFNLNTEETSNWTEVCHLVLGVEEVLEFGNSIG
jgi:hypothetical protein